MTQKILIIDDEEAIRVVVEAALTATTSWQTLLADSAALGMTMAQAEQPDAILLDVMMPELDGIALFHKLKAQALTKGIPVIFLTAQIRVEEQQKIEALGGAGMIIKPFEVGAIAQQIRTLLHWSE